VPEPWTTDTPRVLVVADDHDAGELLTRLLDRAGWATDLAFSAASGLAELSQASPRYSVVVLDLLDGSQNLEALRSIRSTPAVAATRVLICDRGTTRRGTAWIDGTDGYLARPFHGDDYVSEVAAVAARPDDEREAHRHAQIGLRAPDPRR
jgi:DNA-binding response OmpR family regulator